MRTLRLLAAGLALLVPALGLSLTGKAGPYQIELTTDPAVLPVGKASLDIFVTDSSAKPVDGAKIRAIAQMPNMPMGEREQSAVPTGAPGHYRFTQSFSMAGGYEAKIVVDGPQGSGTAVIPMETGKSTAAPKEGGNPFLAFWPWLLGLAAVAFVLVRMRQTGQRLDAKAVLNFRTLASLAFLGAVVVGAVYAVNHWRRTGAMTPIEAQTMNMDMPPPEGVTPVTLATVDSRPIAATVRYSGQAVGFDRIDVAARTTGVIVWMPGYVGTTVRKGEVVARLDTSQLAPQVESQRAAVENARQGVGVAQAERRQSEAMVHQAESELGQFRGSVEEARANLAAAKDDQVAARADVTAARSDVRDAEANLTAAEADRLYWVEELKREAALFASGAVSRDEYEKEKAEATRSEAAARQAAEAVRSAQAKVMAAEARVRRAESMVVAAERKIDQAQSALMSHHAHVRAAKAEASTATHKIGQAATGVRQASAALSGSVAQAGYAEIRAEIDGVITERIVSPGSLVAPGQVLLRISSVAPIRIQANVPEADLAKVRVGQSVSVLHRDRAEAPVKARVTATSPSVDATSRTGVVEAVLPNADRRFLPGQFVSMVLPLGAERTQLTVPAAALQSTVASGDAVQAQESASFVWVTTPVDGQAGRFTVARRPVVTGPGAGDQIAILSGVDAGARVVVTGAAGLIDGQTVAAAEAEVAATAQPAAVVTVTESGFTPATITLSGTSRKVTFIRKTDATCAKDVVFGSLKIRRDLPLNKPVTIELPPGAKGELRYACGMDMIKGAVVIR